MTNITPDAAWLFFTIAVCIAIFVITYKLVLYFLEQRSQMKRELRERRDAMVRDLTQRILFDQLALHDDALEARKNMIRLSFKVSEETRGTGEAKDGRVRRSGRRFKRL
jgi:hypothetical protein